MQTGVLQGVVLGWCRGYKIHDPCRSAYSETEVEIEKLCDQAYPSA
jgi:hypothetical protein